MRRVKGDCLTVRRAGFSMLMTALCLAACGEVEDSAPSEEGLTEAERSAALEAAEKEILNAGPLLPSEVDSEPSPAENGTGSNYGSAAGTANNAF